MVDFTFKFAGYGKPVSFFPVSERAKNRAGFAVSEIHVKLTWAEDYIRRLELDGFVVEDATYVEA